MDQEKSDVNELSSQFDWQIYTQCNSLGHLSTPEDALAHWSEVGKQLELVATEQAFYNAYRLNPSDLPEDFDWQTYLSLNPNVAERFDGEWQAIRHFLKNGIREKRSYKSEMTSPLEPTESHGSDEAIDAEQSEDESNKLDSEDISIPGRTETSFNCEIYKQFNEIPSDVESHEEAYTHWLSVGKSDEFIATEDEFYKRFSLDRENLPANFNWQVYLQLNPDVEEMFGFSKWQAIRHFLKRGMKGGRAFAIDSVDEVEVREDTDETIEAIVLDTDEQYEGKDNEEKDKINEDKSTIEAVLSVKQPDETAAEDLAASNNPALFNWKIYVECNAEASHIEERDSAYQHWLDIGKEAGFIASEDDFYNKLSVSREDLPANFNWREYIALNPDVGEVFGTKWQATRHFLKRGAAGGRIFSFEQKGHIHADEAQWDKALDAFEQAHSIHPQSTAIKENVGLSLENLGRTDDAIAAYQEALKQQPHREDLIEKINLLQSQNHQSDITELDVQGEDDVLSVDSASSDSDDEAIAQATRTEAQTTDRKTSTKGQDEHQRTHISTTEEYKIVAKAFDRQFYLQTYPDVSESGLDPVEHYVTTGWKELRDPAPNFSTAYYLEHNGDIKAGGVNPFFHFLKHGRVEGRKACSIRTLLKNRVAPPSVSVIIPNYNHADFLEERIDSILNQTYGNFDILILDDCSTDNSREVIRRYEERYPSRIRTLFNEKNAGNVFRQWRLGIEKSEGDLIWICESDDSCEPDFLENLVHYFTDPSVMLAFGRIQFIDKDSREYPGLDNYREQAENGIWGRPRVAPSSVWFKGALGAKNVVANVGGCLFRNQQLSDHVWKTAEEYSVCGDWFLYCHLACSGQIAFEPSAKSYFRQHGQNTSVSSFTKPKFYVEHFNVAKTIKQLYGTNEVQLLKFYTSLSHQYNRNSGRHRKASKLNRYFDIAQIVEEKKKTKHVLLCFLGFYLGGGEIFPIHLANQLVEMGYVVSMLALDFEDEVPRIREMLDSRIAIYYKQHVQEAGVLNFVESVNVDIIHSHNLGCEYLFAPVRKSISVPYIVTHHGGYEACNISSEHFLSFLELVDHWVYIADKNIEMFKDLPLSKSVFTKLPNAVAVDDKPFDYKRKDLGLTEQDFVLGIASRALKSKGWEEAIKAVLSVNRKRARKVHLLLCGDGEARNELESKYKREKCIHFLGYRSNIHSFYKMCDCCMLPTRFPGESFPLTLIESIQAGTPIIATDVGEIHNILSLGEAESIGILVPYKEASEAFVRELSSSIIKMTNTDNYQRFCIAIEQAKDKFSIERLGSQYSNLYTQIIDDYYEQIYEQTQATHTHRRI